MKNIHGMLRQFLHKLFAHVRFQRIITVKEERVFASSGLCSGHTSAMRAHVGIVGNHANAGILRGGSLCDLGHVVGARVIDYNCLDVGERLISYGIKTFLQVRTYVVGRDDN